MGVANDPFLPFADEPMLIINGVLDALGHLFNGHDFLFERNRGLFDIVIVDGTNRIGVLRLC